MKKVKKDHTLDTIRIGLTLLLIASAFLIPSFTSFILGKIFVGFCILWLVLHIMMYYNVYYDDEKIVYKRFRKQSTYFYINYEYYVLEEINRKRKPNAIAAHIASIIAPRGNQYLQYRSLFLYSNPKDVLRFNDREFASEDFENILKEVKKNIQNQSPDSSKS